MTRFFIIAAATAAALSAPASAQDHERHGGGGMRADITRAQAQQMADGLFQRLDANHDGTVTRQEVQQVASQPAGERRGRFAGRMAERLFGQSDHVTQAQFQAHALARFDRQDLNRDGTVTADERQQARAARQQRAQ